MKVRAFRHAKYGGPKVLKWTTVDVGEPGPGEVLLRHTAVGLNLADTYRRRGLAQVALPSGLGNEGVGVVEAVGPDVRTIRVGARAGYVGMAPLDAYSEARLAEADRLIALPDDIDDRTAAAVLVKGMTAHYLLRRTYRVSAHDTVVVLAAAGGVGLLMCQWANALGATVIGLVSTDAKARLARRNGCHHPLVVNRSRPRFAAKVRALTDGRGADVVYDSVGRTTWQESLASVRRLGTVANFGTASGGIDPLDLWATAALGSPFITAPALPNYTATRAERLRGARELFARVRDGTIKARINQTYRLEDAARAHKDIEARRTTGSTVMIP